MRFQILLVSILSVCLLSVCADAQARKKAKAADNPEAPQGNNMPAATLAGEIPGERASVADKQCDWPAIAYASDGSLYAIYIEWNDKDADRVVVRKKTNGNWSAPMAIEDGNWDHYSPAIVAHGNGALAIWSGQSTGNYDLYAAEIPASGSPSKPARLTSAPFSDFNARAVSDAHGNVTVVWQSFRSGNADIYAKRLNGSNWGPETRISTSDANDWDPAVALDPKGVAWISWDSYQAGNYDVYLRSFDGKQLGNVIPITTEPTAQFHSSVAVDSNGRVWVAWDEASENWGKDFSAASSVEGSRGLHFSRSLGVRVYANGRVQNVSADISKILTGRMTRYAELPHLAFDSSGALWMVFRHWTFAQPNEIYHFYATKLSGNAWSTPYRLAMSSGANTQHAVLVRNPKGGISVAYSSDGRSQTHTPAGNQAHSLHYNAYVSDLPDGGGPPQVTLADAKLPPAKTQPFVARRRATMTVGGKTYTLLLGDCHRHTDVRGHSSVDGSLLDTYRYAMDAAQLDFLGVSDHNEVVGGTWPDGLRDYQWWFAQKAVDLFTHDPTFIGIYSYEHSLVRPAGHRNMLFLKRGAPLRMVDRTKGPDAPDNSPPELWKWVEKNVLPQNGQMMVIVPHTFAAGPLADWNWPNARFDCLLEIYQGCRGSYEAYQQPVEERRGGTQIAPAGHYAQDALAKGNVYGYVSFSDHGSTHTSWAGVWALSQDRKGLLEGMYDRRTQAGSDEIVMKVTADGHMVGEEFTMPAGKAPLIEAAIDAPDTILRVDVVRDAKYIYTIRPNARTAKLSFRDTDAKPGKTYYYVRVFQRDQNPVLNGAGTRFPHIGWASPFYVTYK
jgi:hypothetical protein